MQNQFSQSLRFYTLSVAIVLFVLLSSMILALITSHIVNGFVSIEHLLFVETFKELFARLFLIWIMLFFYIPLLVSKTVRSRFMTERWHLILLVLFALGAAFAVGDPIHLVREEYNWIRYWTAGALGIAAVTSVLNSLSNAHRLLDRLLGGAFGLLLGAAAGDELFQLHELGDSKLDVFLPSDSQLAGGDMVTLAVAALGAVAVGVAVLAWRFLPWAKALLLERRYRRAGSLLALGIFCFSVAMMLDSFDWYLEQLVDQLRATILGRSGTNDVPLWLGVNNAKQAANSLEELLEYLAALCFLMMIGTLFSVKTLGCDLPSCAEEPNAKAD